jgi:hypothetical protein
MKNELANIGVVAAPFLAIFLFMGATEVVWPVKPTAGNTSQGQAAGSPSARPGASSRAKRPLDAALGHWKDEGANLYVSNGGKGLACTWVFSDGQIEEHPMVIKGENLSEGTLTLLRWYRADQRSGGKPAGVATFSDGREMIEEWRFDAERNSFTVWALHFTDGMTQRQTMRYIDAARKP